MIAGRVYGVDLNRPDSLAIPVQFGGPQPNYFGAPAATSGPLIGDGFVGDTRQGGGCNVARLQLVPHCNGTHTESVGHILDDDCWVPDSLPQSLMPAVLVSLTATSAADTDEDVRPTPETEDALITRTVLSAAISHYADEEITALIVRTLPNAKTKKSIVYGALNRPPFFTVDAMNYIMKRGVQHLLVDIPSIDKMHDDGNLANHHIFWNVPDGMHSATPETLAHKTITEMIYVDNGIADGLYLLNLQVPAFHTDAAPCRPAIYALAELDG